MESGPRDDYANDGPSQLSASEETALVLLAKRDLRAFEPVYRRYARPIHRYCAYHLGEQEAASDATSQTFAKAMAGIEGFRTGSVAEWLFTIARNVVIDMVRYRRPQVDLDSTDGLVARDQLPDEQAIANEQRQAVLDAIRRLTSEQRNVLDLRLVGFSGPEIAEVLGISISAVKSSQFRAFARLRILLIDQSTSGDGA